MQSCTVAEAVRVCGQPTIFQLSLQLPQGTQIIERTYDDLKNLQTKVEMPENALSPLPPRQSIAAMLSPSLRSKRNAGIEDFITSILNHPTTAKDPEGCLVVAEFLNGEALGHRCQSQVSTLCRTCDEGLEGGSEAEWTSDKEETSPRSKSLQTRPFAGPAEKKVTVHTLHEEAAGSDASFAIPRRKSQTDMGDLTEPKENEISNEIHPLIRQLTDAVSQCSGLDDLYDTFWNSEMLGEAGVHQDQENATPYHDSANSILPLIRQMTEAASQCSADDDVYDVHWNSENHDIDREVGLPKEADMLDKSMLEMANVPSQSSTHWSSEHVQLLTRQMTWKETLKLMEIVSECLLRKEVQEEEAEAFFELLGDYEQKVPEHLKDEPLPASICSVLPKIKAVRAKPVAGLMVP